jgi:transposase-like protein
MRWGVQTREVKTQRHGPALHAALPIWQATDRDTVRQRWQAFRERWSAEEPEAVAVITRVWEQTLAYLAVLEHARERGEAWAPQYLRTTSALERVNRALRQKARQVGTFQSATGLTAALALVLAHRGLGRDRLSTDLWTEVLEAGLLAS